MMIGNKIRDLRKEKKLSQNELGKSIGVSQTTVTAWETGRAEPASTRSEEHTSELQSRI